MRVAVREANYSARCRESLTHGAREATAWPVTRGWAAMLVVVLVACAPDPGELPPNEALRAFLTALDRSPHAPDQLKVAYDWIDEKSQAALKQRAELAASLAGRKIAAWDMLVAGRSSFSDYSVPSLRMRVRIDGDKAFVTLPRDGQGSVDIPLVRQQGRWRVVLGLAGEVRD